MWLGPRRTLELLKTVKRYGTSRTADLGRRDFLRHSGIGLLATIFLFGRQKSSLLDSHIAEPSQVGLSATDILGKVETYEGFLFLPTVDAQMPTFVQCATSPILCQVDERHNPAHIGELVWFKSIPELIAYVPFPIYVPATLPTGIEFLNAYTIQYVESGKVVEAIVNFGAAGTQQPLVSVSAQPEFPRPFPIWPVHSPSSDNHIPILPEKISFAPAPGVMQPSVPGYVIHWITNDILYTLAVENNSHREAAADIARSLKEAY